MANRFNRKNNMGGGGAGGNLRRFNNYDREGFDRPRFNPWQSGVMPNNGNMGPGASPEATIALASNLISNFLQSRQAPMPSLLDLNVRRDFGGPNYIRDERFGPKIGRNMQMGGQMNRRVPSGGRNDRVMNKVRRPMRPNTNNKAKTQKTVQEKKETSESKADTGTESVNVDAEVKDEKRDWKTERSEMDLSTATDTPEDEKAEIPEGVKKGSGFKTEFDGILPEFLECHICEKKMWDGRSFDNHIKGRVHNIMMDKTKQSYHMTADAMRQELKINEMKRSKRGFTAGAKRVFCAMCDLYVFYAAAHRRSPGHQKLKKYLHPSCNTCHKEFPTRIELDEHRLTAPHLRLLQDKQKDVQSRPKPEIVTISTLQDELAQVRPMHENKKKGQAKKDDAAAAEGETDKVIIKTEQIKTEDGATDEAPNEDGVKSENAEPQPPEEGVVLLLDYKDGDDISTATRKNLPRYQVDRPVGLSYITDFSCKQCKLCKKFFDTEETAEVHLRTWKHFQSYIKMLHSKGNFKIQETVTAKRELNTDESVDEDENAKRRKTDNDEEINEDELLNGLEADISNGVHLSAEDTTADDSIIDTTAEDLNVSIEPEQPKPVQQTVVQVEKPRPIRGRGRGRGARGRRGRY